MSQRALLVAFPSAVPFLRLGGRLSNWGRSTDILRP
uniref:Uncharacterized protein n=1 Tax=Anguilla anguilla TaxID=7936 RepID=A0A0E9SAS8_ANGAN